MANVEVDVGGRKYVVACRDGEEPHLRNLAGIVDRRARDAAAALGGLTEARQLLFASLLIADDLNEMKEAGGATSAAPLSPPAADPEIVEALESLAERLENLAQSLEAEATPS